MTSYRVDHPVIIINYQYYKTVNMMKYENEYEILGRLSKVISGKLSILFSSINYGDFNILELFLVFLLIPLDQYHKNNSPKYFVKLFNGGNNTVLRCFNPLQKSVTKFLVPPTPHSFQNILDLPLQLNQLIVFWICIMKENMRQVHLSIIKSI